jgi:hypothetical protein
VIAIAARFIGKIQYPKTHTLCKKETLPPRTLALIVTMAAPPQIRIKMTPYFINFTFSIVIYLYHLPNKELEPALE